MIMCVLLCYLVSIRIYYQQGVLFLVCICKFTNCEEKVVFNAIKYMKLEWITKQNLVKLHKY